jgi:hypothetical protein
MRELLQQGQGVGEGYGIIGRVTLLSDLGKGFGVAKVKILVKEYFRNRVQRWYVLWCRCRLV